MVILHNIVLRGLNSIYLQAPKVPPKDYSDFINYCYCWYLLIDGRPHPIPPPAFSKPTTDNSQGHHRAEEERFFPDLERRTNEKGLMDANIAQHDAFHTGLEAYKIYLDSVRAHPHKFSSTKLLSIINNFGPILCTHLADEIPTLLALERYGDKLPIVEMGKAEGRASSKEMEKTRVLMFFFMNHDRDFEGGM